MAILVTGGAGFIGSNLVMTLQERQPDERIIVLDDFSSGSWANLSGFRGDVITADLTQPGWDEGIGDTEIAQVYHLGANTDAREPNQAKMMRQNVDASRLLFRFAAERDATVVYASSAATYGIRDGIMKESDAQKPFSVYALSKCIMENVARHAIEDHELSICGVRFFNVYGPRETHKGVPASMIFHLGHQIRDGKRPRIFEHGEQTRDHVYVKDVVEGTIQAMEKGEVGGVYNLGSGRARSFNDVVAAVNGALGTDLQPEYIKNPYSVYQHHTEADLQLSRRELGYSPKWPLELGVKDYFKWLFA
jgi:ADP-L-glycero-D-manno-heptose 6-epimerase